MDVYGIIVLVVGLTVCAFLFVSFTEHVSFSVSIKFRSSQEDIEALVDENQSTVVSTGRSITVTTGPAEEVMEPGVGTCDFKSSPETKS